MRVGAEKEKGKENKLYHAFPTGGRVAAGRPGKGPGLGSRNAVGNPQRPGWTPGAALGSGTQISGRCRPRQPRGQLKTKRQPSGSDAIRLSHFFRTSRASPAALAQAASRRGGAARPTRKNLPRSPDSKSAKRESKLPSQHAATTNRHFQKGAKTGSSRLPSKSLVATPGERKGGDSSMIGNALSTKKKKNAFMSMKLTWNF